jgi:hypothetical protein
MSTYSERRMVLKKNSKKNAAGKDANEAAII